MAVNNGQITQLSPLLASITNNGINDDVNCNIINLDRLGTYY